MTATTDTLSQDPTAAIQDMMSRIDALRTIYDQETDSLLKADTMTFIKLQEKKIETAAGFQSGMSQLLKRREEIKKTSIALRQQLENKQKEFSESTKKNLDALERMQKCANRLNEKIVNAARKAVIARNTVSYSASGVLSGQRKAVSTGINESA